MLLLKTSILFWYFISYLLGTELVYTIRSLLNFQLREKVNNIHKLGQHPCLLHARIDLLSGMGITSNTNGFKNTTVDLMPVQNHYR